MNKTYINMLLKSIRDVDYIKQKAITFPSDAGDAYAILKNTLITMLAIEISYPDELEEELWLETIVHEFLKDKPYPYGKKENGTKSFTELQEIFNLNVDEFLMFVRLWRAKTGIVN